MAYWSCSFFAGLWTSINLQIKNSTNMNLMLFQYQICIYIFVSIYSPSLDCIPMVIIHQLFSLTHDWSKHVTWPNIPQLKLGNIQEYSAIFKTAHVAKKSSRIINMYPIVRRAFQTSDQPRTLKCAGAWCKTCPFICNIEKLSGPKPSIKITDHFTCTSASVIYCVTCTLCKK